MIAMDKRMHEIEEKKDDRRDMLRKLVELSAGRGDKVNFSYSAYTFRIPWLIVRHSMSGTLLLVC